MHIRRRRFHRRPNCRLRTDTGLAMLREIIFYRQGNRLPDIIVEVFGKCKGKPLGALTRAYVKLSGYHPVLLTQPTQSQLRAIEHLSSIALFINSSCKVNYYPNTHPWSRGVWQTQPENAAKAYRELGLPKECNDAAKARKKVSHTKAVQRTRGRAKAKRA